MDNKRCASWYLFRSVLLILGLALSFVVAGCGILKQGGDEIGDGYLSEDGWDPFANTAQNRRLQPDDQGGVFELGEGEPPGDSAPGAGIGSVAATAQQTDAGMRLEELFKQGNYQLALSSARSLRVKSARNSADRDVAEFIVGASQYYLGKFSEAQPVLDAHVKGFPNSRHRESALYYQASNRVRLREWRVAAALLDNYLSAYPESLLMEFALFDRATCHFGLGENAAAVKLTKRLEREFIYSKIRDRALSLEGDALEESGDLAGAQASYEKALEAAKALKHSDLEARCLANLAAVAAARGQNSAAVGYYDRFFKNHGRSRYATKAARGGMPALQASGRLDSGLETLERILQEMPESTEASVINDTLLEYAKYYREKHGAEKLLRQLGDLSSAPKGSKRLKEQLVIARLEALENYFPEREAEIRVFYKEMRTRFQPSSLSAANVLKMADYIAEESPADAIDWYNNALVRGGSRHRARATLGLAKANARLGNQREAEAGFRDVLETFGSPELAEEATLGIARVAHERKDWGTSAYYWTSYLDHQDWNQSREEARTGLAESKSNGGTPKAPAPAHSLPVNSAPKDPVAVGLDRAEKLAAAGNKGEAYKSLDRLLTRYESIEGLPESSAVPLRRAQIMREDLAIELGE